MNSKELTVNKETKAVTAEKDRTTLMSPAVDILETDDALLLMADLPGVGKENLELGIDRQVLTIEGRIARNGEGTPLYREFGTAGYYRRFHLPDNLDLNLTAAELKDGVLTLRLPKAASAKPRRIEVTVH